MALSYMDRRQQLDQLQKRLKALLQHPNNQVCSECPEPKPTWAVLLEAPVPGGKTLGALCCFQCYSHHFRLGKTVCTVKSANMASDWTEEEVQIMEDSDNVKVNTIYEAFMDEYNEDNEKESLDTFVANKYKERKYFSEKVYHEQTTLLNATGPCAEGRRGSRYRVNRSTSGSGNRHSHTQQNNNNKDQQQLQDLYQENKSAKSSPALDRRPSMQRIASFKRGLPSKATNLGLDADEEGAGEGQDEGNMDATKEESPPTHLRRHSLKSDGTGVRRPSCNSRPSSSKVDIPVVRRPSHNSRTVRSSPLSGPVRRQSLVRAEEQGDLVDNARDIIQCNVSADESGDHGSDDGNPPAATISKACSSGSRRSSRQSSRPSSVGRSRSRSQDPGKADGSPPHHNNHHHHHNHHHGTSEARRSRSRASSRDPAGNRSRSKDNDREATSNTTGSTSRSSSARRSRSKTTAVEGNQRQHSSPDGTKRDRSRSKGPAKMANNSQENSASITRQPSFGTTPRSTKRTTSRGRSSGHSDNASSPPPLKRLSPSLVADDDDQSVEEQLNNREVSIPGLKRSTTDPESRRSASKECEPPALVRSKTDSECPSRSHSRSRRSRRPCNNNEDDDDDEEENRRMSYNLPGYLSKVPSQDERRHLNKHSSNANKNLRDDSSSYGADDEGDIPVIGNDTLTVSHLVEDDEAAAEIRLSRQSSLRFNAARVEWTSRSGSRRNSFRLNSEIQADTEKLINGELWRGKLADAGGWSYNDAVHENATANIDRSSCLIAEALELSDESASMKNLLSDGSQELFSMRLASVAAAEAAGEGDHLHKQLRLDEWFDGQSNTPGIPNVDESDRLGVSIHAA